MNLLMLIVAIIIILIGIYLVLIANGIKKFYNKIKEGNINEYKKVIGTVICDAYSAIDRELLKSIRAVTPIVEYTVKGQTYETMNRVLETGAELPAGTKVYVWYKKNNPKQAILGTELETYLFEKLAGFFLICIGIVFLIMAI